MNVTLTPRATALESSSLQPISVNLIIHGVSFFPPAFELVPRLLLMLDDPDTNCDEFAEIIRVDPGLTANVLRVSQSAVFGGARRADSLAEAIVRLGVREVYRIVMEIVTSSALKMADGYAFGRVDLWRHSLAVAVAAETLARDLTDEDPEMVFSAALLHDIGKPLLARAAHSDYYKLLKRCAETDRSAHEAEQERFQINHTEVAGRLLRSWNFPEPIVTGVAGHHSPAETAKGRIATLIYVGNALAYRIGQGNGIPLYAALPDEEALAALRLTRGDLERYEDEISSKVQREHEKLR